MDDSVFEITSISESDLSELYILYEQLTGKESDVSKAQIVFDKILNNEDYILLGAKVMNRLVGSIMGILCNDLVGQCQQFMVLENFIVKQSYQRMGVGRGLLYKIEEMAKNKDCSYIMLVSGNSRSNSHMFYQKMGYEIDFVKGFKKVLIRAT
jgi:predicted N-acetyltransferase YhbS